MVQTPVTDGSFEDVTALGVDDATSGGWTLAGPQAYFESNTNNAYQTPYGAIFVTFYGQDAINSVSQPVALPSCKSGAFTLSYAYNVPFADDLFAPVCTFSVSYAGEANIDSVVITDTTVGWITRTQTFTPTAASGAITFSWDCSGSNSEIDFLLDNISVT
jgi:hypothetical protein